MLQGYNIKPDLPCFQMEIDKLLTKGVIKETCREQKEFVSPILIYLIKVVVESD